jgi:hypothetical protein
MFFWFLIAAGAVVGLTLIGAYMANRDAGWSDDGPMGPFH